MAAWHPHVGRLRKRRERVARPVRPSNRNELWYRAQLRELVSRCREAGREIAEGLRPTWPVVGDSPVPGLSTQLARAAAKFGNLHGYAERLAREAAARNAAAVDARLAASVRSSIGIDVSPVLYGNAEIHAAMEQAIAENVALIESIPTQYLDGVRAAVEKGWASGARWESIAEQIANEADAADTRAWVIARDQTSKMNAAFNEIRQTQLGIEKYRWSGVLDIRERPSHRAMEGQICRWDSPPLVDGENVHPGEAILCRCLGEPVIDLEVPALPEGEPGAVAA